MSVFPRLRLVSAGLILLAAAFVSEAVSAQVTRPNRGPRVLRVPADFATAQAAVDAAQSGDVVLLSAGEYRESLRITRDSIVIRGVHRDSVVFDGELTRPVGIHAEARWSRVEQLTLRRHAEAGLLFLNAQQFYVRDVAAYNNGAQGIAAVRSTGGVLEDLYTAGSAEAGILVATCGPCRIVVRRVTSENNGIGALVRNAGGDVLLTESILRFNRAGVVLLSDPVDSGILPRAVTVRANLVQGNHSRTAPGRTLTAFAWGNGIVVAGGREHRIDQNAIAFHAGHGVLVAPVGPGGAQNIGIVVGENLFAKSGRGDVSIGGPSGSKSCVSMAASAVRTAPRWLTCGATLSAIAERDLVPRLMVSIRERRHADEVYPDWKSQSAPTVMPAAVSNAAATQRPSVAALLQATVSRPATSDSVVTAAMNRAGPPIHVSPLGLKLASLQSYFPLTRALLVLGALVIVVIAVLTRRKLLTALVGAVYLGWVGLSLAVALLLSSI